MRSATLLLLLVAPAFADGLGDNLPDKVRPIPPKAPPVRYWRVARNLDRPL